MPCLPRWCWCLWWPPGWLWRNGDRIHRHGTHSSRLPRPQRSRPEGRSHHWSLVFQQTSTCPPESGAVQLSLWFQLCSCWGCIHSGPRSGVGGGEEKGCPRPGLSIYRCHLHPSCGWVLGWAADTIKAFGRPRSEVGNPPTDAISHLFQRLSICLWRGNTTLWIGRTPIGSPGVIWFFLFPFSLFYFTSHVSLSLWKIKDI